MDIEKYNAVIVARQIAASPNLTLEEKVEALDELKYEMNHNDSFCLNYGGGGLNTIFSWGFGRKEGEYWANIYLKIDEA